VRSSPAAAVRVDWDPRRVARNAHDEARKPLQLILSVATGVAATSAGLVMLVLAVYYGAAAADVLLEIGVAVGLSGFLWWCVQTIRGQRRGAARMDYSALMIIAFTGAALVAAATLFGHTQGHEVLLSSGAAVVTVWLFVALERQYELLAGEEPAWLKIVAAPLYPILWLVFRGDYSFSVYGPRPTGPLDVTALLDDLELEANLEAWDRDSSYRDQAFWSEIFTPTVEEVERDLSVTLPPDLVRWLETKAGRRLELPGGGIFVWPLAAVRLRPVELPHDVVCFADEWQTIEPLGERTQFAIAIDLRPGAMHGAIVRVELGRGERPRWPIAGPLEIAAISFEAWRSVVDRTP
jgi:hypothetical protein